ncbi:SDR family oxidoreductase [Noviherbaspirillum sp. UKPF54]|uniref:SDR family oxidoreductase n=1 Tax=Noviherbaspirillum sp. UKPF54 TaxID=2601898 RepID=UPI0011B12413|nr:SDR family oxidoreductase [Noviherbaspirillum sp. UKPF54]QDZ30021.1 SDR family oxidoreductase [Noviherbaspirillum sp. UKPF54]
MNGKSILVTGAGGYLGRQLIEHLAARRDAGRIDTVIATDVRETPGAQQRPGVVYLQADIRDDGLDAVLREHRVDTVVHLASIVTPGKKSNRAFEYSVDVEGTRKVLDACVAAGVHQIVISSSGAAYGYHADNPAWLTETDPTRGNQEFAYSWHKRLVEEMLAEYRRRHPELMQTIFRIGTILGDSVRNQITDLFEKPRLIAIRGSDSPFVFIWDQDVVGAFLMAIDTGNGGIFNLAGDGALSIYELAERLGKPVVALPASVIAWALRILKALGLTQYGPEQVNFLRYRPVLDNRRLKEKFGYIPAKSSAAVFDYWLQSRKIGKD